MSDCFDHEGDALWHADLQWHYGCFDFYPQGWGYSISFEEWVQIKILEDDRLDKDAVEFQKQWVEKNLRSKQR